MSVNLTASQYVKDFSDEIHSHINMWFFFEIVQDTPMDFDVVRVWKSIDTVLESRLQLTSERLSLVKFWHSLKEK